MIDALKKIDDSCKMMTRQSTVLTKNGQAKTLFITKLYLLLPFFKNETVN